MARSTVLARGLAGLAVAASAAALAVAVAPAGAAPETSVARVAWARCDTVEPFRRFDCATYPVPVDYADPDGPTVPLALIRRPADDPAAKIGTLFVNPGGPGTSGVSFVRSPGLGIATDAETRRTFDIIGFDPRGVGASSPIGCFETLEELTAALGPAKEVPIGATEIRDTLTAYRGYTDACGRTAGPLLPHLSTLNVARDLDLLRQAVGDERLTFAGYSYGTLIGATYANLFPDRVRALVLDGFVDPAGRTQASVLNEFERAGGFEKTLKAFLAACNASGPGCAFSTGDPAAKFTALRERLRQGPALSGGRTISISYLTAYLASRLPQPAAYGAVATDLDTWYRDIVAPGETAAAGDGARSPAPATSRAAALVDAYGGNSFDALNAVNCLDKQLPQDPWVYPALALSFETAYRTFGRLQAFSASVCATWPVTGERYDGPWDRPTPNPVLVVGVQHDPATPYVFAERGTRQLADARLLTVTGFGHTSLRAVSSCAREKVNSYLRTLAVPPEGTVCPTDSAPFQPA
jgi:pimeloyl-ACP methyl ester carboxylesterase